MDLLVVRHAIAHERDPARWPDDSLRPLTPEGIEKFRKAARGAGGAVPLPDRVWTSPFTRARETAAILTDEAAWPAAGTMPALEADRSADEIVDALGSAATSGVVAIVGHEPTLSDTILLLTGAAVEMKKGAVARIAVRIFGPGGGILRALLPPKTLRSLA